MSCAHHFEYQGAGWQRCRDCFYWEPVVKEKAAPSQSMTTGYFTFNVFPARGHATAGGAVRSPEMREGFA